MVLELTLKHVKALTNLIDQQQQKILALQSGLQAGECPCLARISGGAGAREGGGSSTDGEPAGQRLLLGTFLPRTARARSRWGRCRVSVLRGRAFRVGTLLCHLAGRPGGQMVTGSWAFWLRSFWVPGVSPFLVKCEGPWNSHVGAFTVIPWRRRRGHAPVFSWVSASSWLGVWHGPGRVTAGVFPAFHVVP